jgi:hypothetical protein
MALPLACHQCYDKNKRGQISMPRKAGPGRKPIGSTRKSSHFSTRITEETRGALEAAAAASGRSVSQVAEKWLRLAFERDRDGRDSNDPTYALNFLVRGLAALCVGVAEGGRQCEWHNDATMFETFRLAVASLLERLRPPGEIDASIEGPLIGRTPELEAERAFRQIWAAVTTARAMSPSQLADAQNRPIDLQGRIITRRKPFSDKELGFISTASYQMADAQRALKIKPEGKQK